MTSQNDYWGGSDWGDEPQQPQQNSVNINKGRPQQNNQQYNPQQGYQQPNYQQNQQSYQQPQQGYQQNYQQNGYQQPQQGYQQPQQNYQQPRQSGAPADWHNATYGQCMSIFFSIIKSAFGGSPSLSEFFKDLSPKYLFDNLKAPNNRTIMTNATPALMQAEVYGIVLSVVISIIVNILAFSVGGIIGAVVGAVVAYFLGVLFMFLFAKYYDSWSAGFYKVLTILCMIAFVIGALSLLISILRFGRIKYVGFVWYLRAILNNISSFAASAFGLIALSKAWADPNAFAPQQNYNQQYNPQQGYQQPYQQQYNPQQGYQQPQQQYNPQQGYQQPYQGQQGYQQGQQNPNNYWGNQQ